MAFLCHELLLHKYVKSKGHDRKERITGEAHTWLISIAYIKPKDLGYVAETWTISLLIKHIRTYTKEAGNERISTITESGVYKFWIKVI